MDGTREALQTIVRNGNAQLDGMVLTLRAGEKDRSPIAVCNWRADLIVREAERTAARVNRALTIMGNLAD